MSESSATQKVKIQRIAAAEARSIKAEAVWIDVRTPAEYAETHIEGARLHPLSDLSTEKVASALGAGQPCVLICRSGNRAGQAAEKLAAAGVKNVHVLDGGVLAWEAAGLPVVKGKRTISLERQVRIAAGALVFVGTVLGVTVAGGFLAIPAFVGAGLVFAGVTDTCGMGMMLAKMPWNQRGGGPEASVCRL